MPVIGTASVKVSVSRLIRLPSTLFSKSVAEILLICVTDLQLEYKFFALLIQNYDLPLQISTVSRIKSEVASRKQFYTLENSWRIVHK